MAKIMAVTHIGITVLCLYPTPKGRNPPSSLYINDGCSQCMEPKRRTNNIIEIVSLCICKNRFVSIYDICSYFYCTNIIHKNYSKSSGSRSSA